MREFLKLAFFFLSGFILLNTFSLIQKFILLQSLELALNPIGFIIPSMFGGLFGVIIGYRGLKIHDLNKQLQFRVKNLEEILPICSQCKKICKNPKADEEDRIWIEIVEHLLPQKMSHGYCLDCSKEILKNLDESKK